MVAHYQTCDCNFCGTSLRFEDSRSGQLVNCLHCGMETVLFIPGLVAPYPEENYVLEPRDIGWTRNALGVRSIVGTVINASNRDLDWVKIEFTLVNRQALPVGSTSDCLISFPSKAVWRFQAPVFQTDAAGVAAPMLSCEFGRVLHVKPPTHSPGNGPDSSNRS
jgi:hypothetical protein